MRRCSGTGLQAPGSGWDMGAGWDSAGIRRGPKLTGPGVGSFFEVVYETPSFLPYAQVRGVGGQIMSQKQFDKTNTSFLLQLQPNLLAHQSLLGRLHSSQHTRLGWLFPHQLNCLRRCDTKIEALASMPTSVTMMSPCPSRSKPRTERLG